MKPYLPLLFIFAFGCKQPTEKHTLSQLLSKGKWIDLSYDFSSETIYWPNNPVGFKLDTQFNGKTAGGYYYSSNAFFSPEHGGTHLDAPVHFAKGKWSTDEIPLEQLLGEAVVMMLRQKQPTMPITRYQLTMLLHGKKKTVLSRMGLLFYSVPAGENFTLMLQTI